MSSHKFGVNHMKILDKKTNNKEEIYSIFGIQVCKITKDYNYKIKELLKFIVKEKIFKDYIETKKIKILNYTLYKRVETLDNIEISLFNIAIKRISKVTELKKQLKKIVNSKYNKVFIIKSNLGEAYLFLKYVINELITSEDVPIIIATKKAHLSLIKILVPNIKYQFIKSLKYEVNNKIFKIGEQIVYIAYPLKFYIDAEAKIATSKTHYLNEMYNYFRISKGNKHNFNKIRITNTVKQEINDYLKRNNISKFIFIVKEATTSESIPEAFWKELEEKLCIKTIYNSMNLNIEESYYLSQKASAIISLRSGLSEILSEGKNTHIILYTNFKNRYKFKPLEAKYIINAYSIKDTEINRNNIFEIAYTPGKTIENIINIIKKREGVR